MLARALLEDYMRRLLASVFVEGSNLGEIFDGQAPLATFSARIRLASALGLLAGDEAEDLHTIREIANDFAHGLDHTMSFEEQSIRTRVFNIQAPRILLDFGHLTDKPLAESDRNEFTASARRRFELAVGTLYHTLSERAKATRPVAPLESLLTLLDKTAKPDTKED